MAGYFLSLLGDPCISFLRTLSRLPMSPYQIKGNVGKHSRISSCLPSMRVYCRNTSCSGFGFSEVHCLFVFVLLCFYSYLDSYVFHVHAYAHMHTYLRQPMCCAITSPTLLSLKGTFQKVNRPARLPQRRLYF